MEDKIRIKTEKKDVQRFYDSVGWSLNDKLYEDTFRFEDLRPVSREYIHKCHLRVKEHIRPKGDYFLDVASGPVQYPEYLDYSTNFMQRVCVDISSLALKEARKKLGEKGIYILADIVHLPFKDNVFDEVISLHTIYHVPKEEQKNAFMELYRVKKPGGSVIVVYSWGKYSILMFPSTLLWFIGEKIREIKEKIKRENKKKSKLYYSPQFICMMKEFSDLKFKILVSRSVNIYFQKIFIHDRLYGRNILNMIFSIENKIPHMAGLIGQYPLILIPKME